MPDNLNKFYLGGGVNTALQTPSSMNEETVVPEKCEVDSIVTSVTVGLTADTELTLIVNGSSTTTTFTMPSSLADDSGMLLTASQKHHFFLGDRISLLSDGATGDATAAHFMWVMRR